MSVSWNICICIIIIITIIIIIFIIIIIIIIIIIGIIDRSQRRKLNWYGHFLRMNVNSGVRRFSSGRRLVRGEEKDRNNHGRTK